MLGELLRSFDGPLEISSTYRSILDLQLNPEFFYDTISAINTITTEDIKHLTNKYLHEDTFVKTIAGGYK